MIDLKNLKKTIEIIQLYYNIIDLRTLIINL